MRRGRLAKAEEFAAAAATVHELADEARDVSDAYVTLCVHAGIAAADAICAARLGRYSRGESHEEAAALLATVDKSYARHLQTLLGLKTRAGYSHQRSTLQNALRAGRAMDALMTAARSI